MAPNDSMREAEEYLKATRKTEEISGRITGLAKSLGIDVDEPTPVRPVSARPEFRLGCIGLKRIFDLAVLFEDDISVKFSQEDLVMRKMDPSRISMLDVNLPKQVFEIWYPPAQLMQFQLNSKAVSNVLSGDRGACNVFIDSKYHVAEFSFENSRKSIIAIESNTEDFSAPRVLLTNRYLLDSIHLKKALSSLKGSPANAILICGTSKEICFKHSNSTVLYNSDTPALISINAQATNIKNGYMLDMFKKSCRKLAAISPRILIETAQNLPIKLTSKIWRDGEVAVWIAPRMGIE